MAVSACLSKASIAWSIFNRAVDSVAPTRLMYTLGCPPAQDASHHQEYYIFSRGSQPKPSFATGILGGGTTQCILTSTQTMLQPTKYQFQSTKKVGLMTKWHSQIWNITGHTSHTLHGTGIFTYVWLNSYGQCR